MQPAGRINRLAIWPKVDELSIDLPAAGPATISTTLLPVGWRPSNANARQASGLPAGAIMRNLGALLGMTCCLFAGALTLGAPPSHGQQLRIDVPVVLKDAKIVLNLDHQAFEGDEPKGLRLLGDMIASFKRNQTKARIVAIFHGESGYMLLDDAAYDRVRNWRGGNPYKPQLANLMREGVEIEECGYTMAVRGWSNAELLPDVKVNTGAAFRIVQLVQEGFVQLEP